MIRSGRARTAVVLGAFASLFVILCTNGYRQTSAVWDEPQNLVAGYVALRFQDYRVDPDHPPLLRQWAALPLLAMPGITVDRGVIDGTPPAAWVRLPQYSFVRKTMYLENDADAMLYRERFMVVLLGVLLGVLLFSWARAWLGFWPATAAVAGLCLEPNILAHASLATTDLGVTCFFFGAVYFAWRISRHLTLINLGCLALFVALAVVTKFTALLLGPLLFFLLAVRAVRRAAWPCRVGRDIHLTSVRRRLTAALAILALVAVASWGTVWAVYGFRYAPSDTPGWLFAVEDSPQASRTPALAGAVRWINAHRLLPNAYSEGFLLGQVKAKDRPAFFAGRYSATGWWYYFPAAFLLKTPIALLLLFAGGLAACTVRRDRLCEDGIFLLAPTALYLVVAMTANVNIGLRHILPVYPFVILLAALFVSKALLRWRWPVAVLLGILALAWGAEVARAGPHYLAFFNQLAGGPANGHRYLVDSNLDWGQELKSLKRWMDDQGVREINLAYFGMADPSYYGIRCTYLPGSPLWAEASVQAPRLPGHVAVSATVLSGAYLGKEGRAFYRPLAGRQPEAVIGHSLFVYQVEQPWW